MASDDCNAHGRAGQALFVKDDQKVLDRFIGTDVLDEIIHQQKKHLQSLLKLRGKSYNPLGELCKEVGISKKCLAYAIVLQEKGNITISELARRLNVNRSSIHKHWPEVVRAIKSL